MEIDYQRHYGENTCDEWNKFLEVHLEELDLSFSLTLFLDLDPC